MIMMMVVVAVLLMCPIKMNKLLEQGDNSCSSILGRKAVNELLERGKLFSVDQVELLDKEDEVLEAGV